MPVQATSPLKDEIGPIVEDTGRALQAAEGLEGVVHAALDSLVPRLADLGVLILAQPGPTPRVEVAHSTPSAVLEVRRQIMAALDPLVSVASANLREGRQARWIPDVNDTSLRFLTRRDAELGHLVQALELRSVIVLALRASGRTLGALALGSCDDGSRFDATDFSVTQILGRRISLAIETATLTEDLQQQLKRPRVGDAIHKWARVFDLAGWGAAIVDGLDYRIETVNPAFARLHGYGDPADLTGRLFTELLPDDRAGEVERWHAGPEGLVYESCHRRLDGTMAPVLVSVTPMDNGTASSSHVITVQDLTDLKRTEERLQRAQRMEAVGRLAGGVAHEVNNMMTIVLGFSDLLSRELEQSGTASQREVEEIRKAALRAAKITTQLLAFSRQQVLQPVDLGLNQVVQEMVPVLSLMLPANVRVETALSPRETVVRADRSQLEQVLINLAFNARDAMSSGGTITFTTAVRELDEASGRRLIGIPIPPGRYGLISVVDTGHGMDPDTLAQVFEPFFTTKPVGSGTGLGLSTVYGIVKQSGGYVWVESAEGEGTSFTMCLPEVERTAPEARNEAVEPDAQPAQGGTVLILEDEDGVRELAARILRNRGYHVLQARNGMEALAGLKASRHAPGLLLTDVVVPDMGTGELEFQIHELEPDLPILYMSGYPRDDILYRGLLQADQPFLQKPFSGEDLIDYVERTIRRE